MLLEPLQFVNYKQSAVFLRQFVKKKYLNSLEKDLLFDAKPVLRVIETPISSSDLMSKA